MFCSGRHHVLGAGSALGLVGAAAAMLGLAMLLAGCSDSTQPASQSSLQGTSLLAGSLDPGTGTFRFEILSDPGDGSGEPVPIELIGSNLRVDVAAQTVAIDVALHNITNRKFYAPARVIVRDLSPPSVMITNADFVIASSPPFTPPGPVLEHPGEDPSEDLLPIAGYGFSYDEMLGEDGILEPDETSQAKTWIFHVPDLIGFAFSARATFGLVPDVPRIAGLCFEDLNRNGIFDQPDELLILGGHVDVHTPAGECIRVSITRTGRYSAPVEETGLYRVVCFPFVPDFFTPIFTTPNPLQVVLMAGADGLPVSYLEADFGVFFDDPGIQYPPVILIEAPSDSLVGAHYHYLNGWLRGDILSLRVGYSGCQPEHPFTLYMVGHFMESMPVQARLVLVYDGLGEACDAYFEKMLHFDLGPIRQAHIEAYGKPGIVILNFHDYLGEVHRFTFGP